MSTYWLNYMRNAVKIAVDAYDGSVTYYVSDETDPIIRSYRRIFPGVFRPMAEMPDDLMAHIRYPEDFFTVQARQFLTYHMTDVRVFYNKEDLWEIPTEIHLADRALGQIPDPVYKGRASYSPALAGHCPAPVIPCL